MIRVDFEISASVQIDVLCRMALCDGNRLENIDDDSPVFPEGNYYYDLTDPDFEKWVTSARKMQNTYAIMNGETDYFE